MPPSSRFVPMKTARRFKGSWFLTALVLTIILGEALVWWASDLIGFRYNPLVVAFLCAGLVAAVASALYEGCEID